MDKDSKFMTDHSEGDKGKEALLNFQLSWALRMSADKEYTKDKPVFYLFCKYMILKLLGIEIPSLIKIEKVKVWKEWENIDICAEVVLEKEGKKEYHSLLIENKVYTNMQPNQRDNYPITFKEYYQNKPDKKEYIPHFVLITCVESNEELNKAKSFCDGTEWEVFSIYDIILDLDIETESELFNEFWIYRWNRLND